MTRGLQLGPWSVRTATGLINAPLMVLAICLQSALTQAATVIEPKGDTATYVTTDAQGKATVSPAPPRYDVSYNAFTRFDVGPEGADFDNNQVNARTIVAEVFSASPSQIDGPLTIDGPRANLIFANQNGVRVNGGSFVNFGSVALASGRVALRDITLAPGYVRRYVNVATREGEVAIEAGGLSAALIRLELIAKRVGIEGPITNAYTSPTATVRVAAGDSMAQFDTAASPTDNLTPWVYYQAGQAEVTGIAIDIAAAASVTSGRIEMLVTDHGAGVRNAGQLLANAGDFVLTSTGQVEQQGGRIGAAGTVAVQAGSFSQSSRDGVRSQVVTGQQAHIRTSGDIVNNDGLIQGMAGTDATLPYSVALDAGGAIVNRTTEAGSDADGAIIYGGDEDISLKAGGNIENINARVVTNGRLIVEAGNDAINRTEFMPGSGRSDWSSEDDVLFGLLSRKRSGYRVELGQLADATHLAYWVAGEGMTVTAANLRNEGGYLFANEGDIEVKV